MIAEQAESKREEVMEAMRSVIDPEIGLNIVELGLIRNLEFNEEGNAKVTMILTTPFCPYGPQIIQQTRMTVDAVMGGGSVVEMGTELCGPIDDGRRRWW